MRKLRSTIGLFAMFVVAATVHADGWKVGSNGNVWIQPCSHSKSSCSHSDGCTGAPSCEVPTKRPDAPAGCHKAVGGHKLNGACNECSGSIVDECDACDSGCGDGCRGGLLCNGKCCWDQGYGPSLMQRRGTLFQWSYGTSFGGGPDLDAPLVTDRPDFTEASSTVGLGVAQIEFGYTYTYNDDNDVRVSEESIGEPLLRYGIFADWLELRLAAFPMVQETRDPQRNTVCGIEDLYIGLKWGLTPQEGCLPEMALITEATVPTGDSGELIDGDDPLSNDEFLPGFNLIYAWELNDTFSIAGSTACRRSKDEGTDATYSEIAQSATVGMSFTEKLGGYTEWFALFPSGADTQQVEHYFNGGFTVLLSNDVQWDVRAGTGLTSASDDFFVGTGLSIRFQ